MKERQPSTSEPQDGASGPSVTIRDVAVAADVSVGTVSNVLNRPNSVAPATLRRVQRAIEDLGFVRHAGAALMRGGRARTIGLVVLDVSNPYFTELARGAEDAARERDHLVILCNSDENRGQERRYLEALEEQRVHGILISPVDDDPKGLDWLRRRGTAVVLLERSRAGFCSVRTDDIRGGELAADHLLDLGHRKLLYVSPPRTIRQYDERLVGVLRAVERRGLSADTVGKLETGTRGGARDGRSAALEILRTRSEVTGIVCGNDLLALGLVAALLRNGVSVPGDVSVVGYDDIELAEQSALPLTTIRQPKQNMGRTGATLLLDEADQGLSHAHQEVVFQPELVVRESTALAAAQSVPA